MMVTKRKTNQSAIKFHTSYELFKFLYYDSNFSTSRITLHMINAYKSVLDFTNQYERILISALIFRN